MQSKPPAGPQTSRIEKLKWYAGQLMTDALAAEKAGDCEQAVKNYLQAADLLLLLSKNEENYTAWNSYADRAAACHKRVRALIASQQMATHEEAPRPGVEVTAAAPKASPPPAPTTAPPSATVAIPVPPSVPAAPSLPPPAEPQVNEQERRRRLTGLEQLLGPLLPPTGKDSPERPAQKRGVN